MHNYRQMTLIILLRVIFHKMILHIDLEPSECFKNWKSELNAPQINLSQASSISLQKYANLLLDSWINMDCVIQKQFKIKH